MLALHLERRDDLLLNIDAEVDLNPSRSTQCISYADLALQVKDGLLALLRVLL
jgi:hypothetical protein